MSAPPTSPAARPLDEREIDELQAALDAIPAPLEPLDVSMLDGYLCGVLLQPNVLPAARWLPYVADTDGRALPAGFDAARLHALTLRRHAELDAAIARRQWFDPWIFELEDADSRDGDGTVASFDDDDPEDAAASATSEAVFPWVAGFATAMDLFPELMALDAQRITEPLALVYRHFSPDDLEDADELLDMIEQLEPPTDLTAAVEEIVRATLLLADVSRPLAVQPGRGARSPRHSRKAAPRGAGGAPRRRSDR